MKKDEDLREKGKRDKRFLTFFRASSRVCEWTFFLLIVVLFAAHFLSQHCHAQKTGETTENEDVFIGTGRVIDENIADARNEAISEAFVKAIEEYLIRRIGPQGMANNFQRLDEEILSRSKEAVQDYQIISEFRTERYVRVLMKARVNEVVLEQKLKTMGLLEIDVVRTDILFVVSQKKEGFATTYWWGDPTRPAPITETELALSRVFEERGFRVINRSFLPPEESYDEGMLRLGLSDEDVAEWGKLFSAQIVVAGEANLYGQSRATVFLRAVKLPEGVVVAQGYRQGVSGGTAEGEDKAIGLAVTSWANDMIPHIMAGLEPGHRIVSEMIIKVNGLDSYGNFLVFKDFLKSNFPQITSVLERRLTKNSVTLGVKIEGGSKDLAEKVLNHPDAPFSFEIYELS
ncbi:MAG: hypothetical protein JSV40_06240, partial [Deltaproteobacteria bacterium]